MLYTFIDINGKQYNLAVNQHGKGSPSTTTEGLIGTIYMDENDGNLYKCTKIEGESYTWEPVNDKRLPTPVTKDNDKVVSVNTDGDYELKYPYYPLQEETETTKEILPNIYHKWGEVTSLTLTLGAPIPGVINEYIIEFISPTQATNLSIPSTVKWVQPLIIESGKMYQISIVDNLGVCVGVNI